MTPLEELRSIGSFSGAMFKVLEDFEARLKAVEAHGPILSEIKDSLAPKQSLTDLLPHPMQSAGEIVKALVTPAEPPALPDAATPDSVGTGVESPDVPGGITITTATPEPPEGAQY